MDIQADRMAQVIGKASMDSTIADLVMQVDFDPELDAAIVQALAHVGLVARPHAVPGPDWMVM